MQIVDVVHMIQCLFEISPTSVVEEIIMTPTLVDY
jgi:hypothetical protein